VSSCRLFVRYANAKTRLLDLGIAVTFGTFCKFFDRRGPGDLRFEVILVDAVVILTTKAQTRHHLVVTFDICTLQIIQHTSALRDHLEQAAPRVVVLLMYLEVLGELVNSLAE
jgi:hypothetical protein